MGGWREEREYEVLVRDFFLGGDNTHIYLPPKWKSQQINVMVTPKSKLMNFQVVIRVINSSMDDSEKLTSTLVAYPATHRQQSSVASEAQLSPPPHPTPTPVPCPRLSVHSFSKAGEGL